MNCVILLLKNLAKRMKRILLTAMAALLSAFPLPAQEQTGRPAVETANQKVLGAMAAHPAVVAQKRVPRADFYLWYSHLTEGVWGSDRNWYPNETEVLYLARATEEGDTDIIMTRPGPDRWTTPEPFCEEAVSPGNEIFPMLSPDGRRLYFASDGLFGAGGYDLYVATWNPAAKSWGEVRNLGFPFNSPGDDLLFCDTPDGRFSLLASNRACGEDSVVIYVLRQETSVFAPVSPEEAARLAQLSVTDPDPEWTFVKRNAGKTPVLDFEQPKEEPTAVEAFRVGKEGAFARSNRLPDGIVYQIQIFVTGTTPSIKQLKGLSPVYSHRQRSGKTLYAVGCWRTYEEAERALPSVKRAGFSSAFVIAFENGQSLPVKQARKKESSVTVVTEEIRIVK